MNKEDFQPIPGTKFSRISLMIGLGINSLMFFVVMFLYWFEIGIYNRILIIYLPRWLNWIGFGLTWLYYYWGIKVMQYNVNYLPLYKPLPNKYILVTGGPYRWIRHPMYICKISSGLFLFLISGFWLQIIGIIIAIIALPSQVKGEEKLMLDRFGRYYQEYSTRTGRFFPKLQFK
jgi:protein-S-isoprenylcysteine O-methyltransferase Ste14